MRRSGWHPRVRQRRPLATCETASDIVRQHRLQNSLFHLRQLGIRHGPAHMDREILDIVQGKDGRIRLVRRADAEEVNVAHVIEHKRRTQVRLRGYDLDVVEPDARGMTDVETVRRHGAEHIRFGIACLFFGRLDRRLFFRAAALVPHLHVADRDVLDGMTRNPADDGAEPGDGIGTDQVADDDSLEGAHGSARRPAHAAAQAQEDRRAHDIAHRDVRDGYVFQQRAIHGFQGESLTPLENAVRDGDVTEAAIRFGAEFDSPGMGNAHIRAKSLVSAIEQRALFKAAANIAVSDGDKLGGFGRAKSVATLQADTVIPGRVDIEIGDAHVAAAIDIHAVAVGVYAQVVDGEVVDSGGQYAEVPAV